MPNREISQITIPNPAGGTPLTFDIKDTKARQMITNGLTFHVAVDAATTPYGVTWDDDGTLITGTLVASVETTGFYLVPCGHTQAKDAFAEYVTVATERTPATVPPTYDYSWEKIGDTEIDFSHIAQYLDTTVTKPKDEVLGSGTTFTDPERTITFTGGTSDTFVKSYTANTNKLETTSIKGVGTDTTFTSIDTATDYTATETVFGTDTTASRIVTESKEATKVTFDTDATASHVNTSQTQTKNIPQRADAATNTSRIGTNDSVQSILQSATVADNSEVLVFGDVSVSHSSVTGVKPAANDATVTDYVFDDVTVPQITNHTDVTVASVKTNSDVTVPVVTSNTSRTMTKVVTKSTTAATSAASATTVATGSLNSNDTVGASVAIGLNTPTTASAVTNIGTGKDAEHSITVGNNDLVNAVTDVTVTVIDKT